nr:hypothetical protein [Tanacetum cinerariifolium]
MNSPKNHEWEYLLDIVDSDLNLSAHLRLTNIGNFNDAPTHEMDHVDEKSWWKLYDDVSEGEDFKMLSWVKALEYINDNGEIGGGCFGNINSYLKKGKLEKVVAIITSCKPNMLGDMNITLKDPSGTISGTIRYKVLLNDDVSKAIKVGSAIILQNRELRMTRLLTDLCHEVTNATRDKVGLIEEVKQLGIAAQGSDSLAYIRILCDEDIGKARSIMDLIK